MENFMTNIIWKLLGLTRSEKEIEKLKHEIVIHSQTTTKKILKMNIQIQDGVTFDIAKSIGFASRGVSKVTSK